MALTPLQVADVCGQPNIFTWPPVAQNEPCKFLHRERVDGNTVSVCLKLAPSRVEELKKSGALPHNFDKAPDKCPGYPYRKYVKQGYDVP